MQPNPPDSPAGNRPTKAPFFTVTASCCNVAPYVRECLDSLLSQPFQDWECVIWAEESTDGTEDILREYAARDPRFHVHTGPRSGGVSASRNKGIELARGEYILFVDGDDYLVPGSLLRIHDAIAAHPGADLYPCLMRVRDEMTGRDRPDRDNYPRDFNGELTGLEATRMAYSFRRFPCPMLQLTVFRRQYLVDQDLKCLPGRRRQDSEFAPRALYLARRVVPLHEPLYVYRIRGDSISTLSYGTGYYHEDYAAILASLLAFHSRLVREGGSAPAISRLWEKQWTTWIFYYWFSPRAIRETPRRRRRETLARAFPDGFAGFDALLRGASASKRIAVRFMKFFLLHPRAGWLADLFFRCLYFPLGTLRDRLRAVR